MEAEISVITCPCVDRISESLRENDENSILDGKCRKRVECQNFEDKQN